MAVFNFKTITTYCAGSLLGILLLISFAMAESVQPIFQKAVQSKDCETVIKLFPKLVAENNAYYGTLSNFYEKGICLPQDYKKAFETFLKTPSDFSGLREIKLGQFYANGWGVAKNQIKARELFQQGVEKELLRHDKFSDVRFGLDLILGTKTFPEQLEKILSFYQQVNWTVDQKYDFAAKFIKKEKSKDIQKQAYFFLMRLVSQYNHAPSAYSIAKWYEKNEGFEAGSSYLYISANYGNIEAQADIGRSYFFKKFSVFTQRVAYEMLYRAYLAGAVSEEELGKAEQDLNKWEIQWGREEAAKPLPAK